MEEVGYSLVVELHKEKVADMEIEAAVEGHIGKDIAADLALVVEEERHHKEEVVDNYNFVEDKVVVADSGNTGAADSVVAVGEVDCCNKAGNQVVDFDCIEVELFPGY